MHDCTKLILEWAQRTQSVSDGADPATTLLVALYACRHDLVVESALEETLGRAGDAVCWPDSVLAAYRIAADGLPRPMSIAEEDVRVLFDRHGISGDIEPGPLVRHILSADAPEVLAFLTVNGLTSLPRLASNPVLGALADANRLVSLLKERVLGQDNAVRMFGDAYFLARIGGKRSVRGIFTLVGPPGVGKTLLAEAFAHALTKLDKGPVAFRRFDMGSYGGRQNFEGLLGSEAFYKNSRSGTLTSFVHNNPNCVLLFDEIEKSHQHVHNALLGMVDSGTLEDKAREATVSFEQAWIIFTTNLGQEVFRTRNDTGVISSSTNATPFVFDVLKSATATARDERGPALSLEFVSRMAQGGAVIFGPLEVPHYVELVTRGLRYAAEGGIVPAVEATDDAKLLFVLSTAPDVDARRVVARSRAWASELIRRGFETFEKDLGTQSPHDVRFDVVCGEEATGYLRETLREATRVLVVDEHEVVLPILRGLGEEIEITRVESTDAALLELSRMRPHIVVLDLSIHEPPESTQIGSGLEILEAIRRRAPEVPVYVYSEEPQNRARFDEIVSRLLRRGGARGYFAAHSLGHAGPQRDDFAHRLAEALKEARYSLVLKEHERTNRTVHLRLDVKLVPSAGGGPRVVCTICKPQPETVLAFRHRSSGFKFAGVPAERFSDVIGLERATRRLQQVASFLRDPASLRRFAVSPPRGLLLAGPPGTGKTMLARALAGEAGVPFLALSASELVSSMAGPAAERIRDLFDRASAYAPAIVFIDEIDAVGARRSADGSASSYQHAGTLNQLLASMDGFNASQHLVFVLAATNRPDVLDPALRRPGRFDEVLACERPAAAARRRLLEAKLLSVPGGVPDDMDQLVRSTAGMVPAELDRLARESAYLAMDEGSDEITSAHLEQAWRMVRFGAMREDFAVSERERAKTAYHESAHALVHLLLDETAGIEHLSILANERGALGHMSPAVNESANDITSAEARNRIAVCLAGRAAERLVFGADSLSAGCRTDLQEATNFAHAAVTEWGFDDELGPVAVSALGRRDTTLGSLVSARILHWLRAGERTADHMLVEHRSLLDELAAHLIERELLTGREVEVLVRDLYAREQGNGRCCVTGKNRR